MSWWNAPLLSPAIGCYCLLAIGAAYALLSLWLRATREGDKQAGRSGSKAIRTGQRAR